MGGEEEGKGKRFVATTVGMEDQEVWVGGGGERESGLVCFGVMTRKISRPTPSNVLPFACLLLSCCFSVWFLGGWVVSL